MSEKPTAVSESTSVPQPEIVDGRLLLRRMTSVDAPQVFRLINDREIASNTRSIPYPYPEPQASEWIESHADLWDQGKSAIFGICLVSDSTGQPELCGAIGLEINSEFEHAELGYWIGREFWNQGICGEAARILVDFGFEHLNLHRIHAHHLTRNPASGRVLEKAGMKFEGTLRHHIKKWGVFEDIAWYGILRSEWQTVQTK